MNKQLKEEAKSLISGIRVSLFIPTLAVIAISALSSMIYIGALFVFFFNFVISLYYYKFVNTKNRNFSTIYEDYKNIDNIAALLKANVGLIIFQVAFVFMFGLGIFLTATVSPFFIFMSLAFIVPILLLSYYFFPLCYIIKDSDYKIKTKDAFKLSVNMMKGNKWNLFCLQFSFFLHFLLLIVTCGIYSLWLSPYYNVTMSLFYIKIRDTYLERHSDSLTDNIRPFYSENEEDIKKDDLGDFESPEDVLKKNDDNIFVDLKDDDIIVPDEDDVIFEEIKEDK